MLIKCKALLPNDDQANNLGVGKHYFPGQMVFGLKIDQEYIVYCVSILGGAPWVDIISESGLYCYSVPLCLFDIIDNRVSRYWKIQICDDGDILFWPKSFYKPYYHDDLSEGIPEVVADFLKVKKLIDEEASSETL